MALEVGYTAESRLADQAAADAAQFVETFNGGGNQELQFFPMSVQRAVERDVEEFRDRGLRAARIMGRAILGQSS